MCGMYWVFSVCGKIGWWRRGSAHGGRSVREQRWMRHVSHQMTTLDLVHKDDNAILEPSALCVRSALVTKLYYTNMSCEWVSCLHDPCLPTPWMAQTLIRYDVWSVWLLTPPFRRVALPWPALTGSKTTCHLFYLSACSENHFALPMSLTTLYGAWLKFVTGFASSTVRDKKIT